VSAGKRHSTRIRHATPWLKTTLIQGAWAATRKKDSYLHAQFVRLKSRRGPKKAIVAVAASMLTAAYFMLRDGVEYHDLGGTYSPTVTPKRRRSVFSAACAIRCHRRNQSRLTRRPSTMPSPPVSL